MISAVQPSLSLSLLSHAQEGHMQLRFGQVFLWKGEEKKGHATRHMQQSG